MDKKRAVSFLITALIYVVAIIAAIIVFYYLKSLHLIISTLVADIVATLVVWLFGIILKNSSVYDPYWSVIPIAIALFWMIYTDTAIRIVEILFLAAFSIWGIRLTYNWIKRWRGLEHQDWRYTMLKKRSPKFWFFTNLVGINLMPTLIVFICMVPVYYGITAQKGFNIITIVGFLVCMGAVAIQAISDKQMDDFRQRNPGTENIDSGLWKYSRHPNYFGEVMFWWGIYIIQLSVIPRLWFTIIGPVVMTVLFMFISIPMMERHIISSRPGYSDYRQKVSRLIPWIRK